jgi:hypothetical protein
MCCQLNPKQRYQLKAQKIAKDKIHKAKKKVVADVVASSFNARAKDTVTGRS